LVTPTSAARCPPDEAPVVADLDETARSAAWDEVREHLGRFETAGGLETELEVIVGSGQRPG
jgi:hypothetical protein